MITLHSALSIRRRGSNQLGKNGPTRSLGIRSSTCPAGLGSSPGAAAVALVRAGTGSVALGGADRRGGLGVDQPLHALLQQPAEQLLAVAVTKARHQVGTSGIIVMGHRVGSFR